MKLRDFLLRTPSLAAMIWLARYNPWHPLWAMNPTPEACPPPSPELERLGQVAWAVRLALWR